MNKTRDDIIDELSDRSTFLFELDAEDPDGYEEDGDIRNAVAAAISNHQGSVTLLVEVGADITGQPFVLARAVDADGVTAGTQVFDSGESVMITA